jgi:hypothetical protein
MTNQGDHTMLNVNAAQENLKLQTSEGSLGHGLRRDVSYAENSNIGNQPNSFATSDVKKVPKLETHPRKHGVSWLSAEKINGITDPKQHVDWVMMSHFGISLEYQINCVHNLCDQGYCHYETIEAVMAHFGFDEMHANVVSESIFGESFHALIVDIHGWITDYEPEESDDWSRSKRGIHDYVVWAVMEELAFDEVNPNP